MILLNVKLHCRNKSCAVNPCLLLTTSSWVSHQTQSAVHWLSCSSTRSNVNSIHQCPESLPLHPISLWPISRGGKSAWWTQLFPVTMLESSHRHLYTHTHENFFYACICSSLTCLLNVSLFAIFHCFILTHLQLLRHASFLLLFRLSFSAFLFPHPLIYHSVGTHDHISSF